MTLNYQLPSSLSFDTCDLVDKEVNNLLSQQDYDAVVLDASNTKYSLTLVTLNTSLVRVYALF